jgi:hypothetical protein
MTSAPAIELAELLARTRHLLLDFDGRGQASWLSMLWTDHGDVTAPYRAKRQPSVRMRCASRSPIAIPDQRTFERNARVRS